MEVHNIYLIGGEDDEAAEFIQSEKEDRCSLVCTYRGKRIEASADDFFEALCELRRLLQTDGLIPFCYGASLNVFSVSDEQANVIGPIRLPPDARKTGAACRPGSDLRRGPRRDSGQCGPSAAVFR